MNKIVKQVFNNKSLLSSIIYSSQKQNNNNLLFLPATLTNAISFEEVALKPQIINKGNVHLVDQRNHGNSPRSMISSYEELAQDIINYIDFHKLKNVVLIGHSLGGRIAMKSVLMNNQAFNKLIKGVCVVDVMPIDYFANKQQFPQVMQNQCFIEDLVKIDLNNKSQQQIEQQLLEVFKGKQQFVNSIFNSIEIVTDGNQNKRFRWIHDVNAICNNWLKFLEYNTGQNQYHGPIQFIFPDKSYYVDFNQLHILKEIFPNIDITKDVIKIKKSSHFVYLKNPKEFVNTLDHFISKIL